MTAPQWHGLPKDSSRGPSTSLEKMLLMLGGSSRLEILQALTDSPQTVSALADRMELDMSSISHNLHILKEQDLVVVDIHRREHSYHLSERITAHRVHGRIEMEIRVADTIVVELRFEASRYAGREDK
jgi:DNA-binding transcriptional ArsR family regulator